jgi:cytosine/adenosine deaminase-related metal-dependent hydrolase
MHARALPRAPLLFRGGDVVTMDARRRVLRGCDVLLAEGRIQAVGPRLRAPRGAEVRDCRGCAVIPGLIQAHVHLCQVLFRNHADGLELLDWLRERIWPFEAAHDARSLRLSAQLGIAELLLGGTTAVLDMATVRHSEQVLRAAAEAGIRYTGGKALMDQGQLVPAALLDPTDAALREAERLGRRWHGAEDGRLRWALCPRFVLSCSEPLWSGARALSERHGWLIHTHASENKAECEAVRAAVGDDNVAYFERLGLASRRLVLAHCVHLTPREEGVLARTGATAVHCPGANLKLASGVMPLPRLLRRGINVALGGDGAPCNNTLDAFHEMRLAATLHLPRFGPRALPPADVLALATSNGARALGLEREIGSLEEGKRADLAVVDLRAPHLAPAGDDLHATLVYGARAGDVRDVAVDGRLLVADRSLATLDARALSRAAPAAMAALARRAQAALDAARRKRRRSA